MVLRGKLTPKSNDQNVAIAGAGITGAYLYKLLAAGGFKVDIYDVPLKTPCGLTPCAWGTSRGFSELVESCGLNPEAYILEKPDYIIIDGVRVPAELMTFDKPTFIKDLLLDAEVKHSPLDTSIYDRVIDATGVARAFLSKIDDDIILRCVQRRVRTDELLENRIKLGNIGYAWCFPLSNDSYHIGCGSLIADPVQILDKVGWTTTASPLPKQSLICACAGRIRVTAPHYSQPFVVKSTAGEIWGVGEAIGCVAPLAGDGIVPGMKSVRILLDNWDDPEGYTRAILHEFKWMQGERTVVDKLRKTRQLALRDAQVLRTNSKRMGIHIGLRAAAQLLQHLT